MKRAAKKTATKRAASFRLTPESLATVAKLAARLGVSQASVVEMAVREFAERRRPASATASR